MVVKPFSHLVRRSTKVLAHHAQSITAASSTSTSQHFEKYSQYRYGKPGHQQRESFHTSSHAAPPNRVATNGENHQDGSLDAYASAWQKHQQGDEAHQFHLSQRIGWKPSKHGADAKLRIPKAERTSSDVGSVKGLGLDRAHSAGDVEAKKEVSSKDNEAAALAEAAAIAKIDEAIAREIKDHHYVNTAPAASQPAEQSIEAESAIAEDASSELVSETARSPSPVAPPEESHTPASSVESVASSQYVDHILYLEKSGAYAQIPAVFEALLRRGVTPPSAAYNALIAAAIRLPSSAQQVVSKVLDVYADMLRRNVFPDQLTFSLVLEVLAVRAVQTYEARSALEKARFRFASVGGREGSVLHSQETEYEILREDDSLAKAIKVFDMAIDILPRTAFSAGTYRVLIEACAIHGELDHMLRLHAHMESKAVVPYASVYPAMINAFASSGDLFSAVETYEGYRSMAMTDDQGDLKLLERTDGAVYAALVRGYLACGKDEGASKFLAKLKHSESASDVQNARLSSARDAVVVDAFIKNKVDAQEFEAAIEFSQTQSIQPAAKQTALAQVCVAAADSNVAEPATKAYSLIEGTAASSTAYPALLALHLRQADFSAARNVWSAIINLPTLFRNMVEPATLFAVCLAKDGAADEGLAQARLAFSRVRSSEESLKAQSEASEMIDEAIEYIGSSMAAARIIPSAQASMTLMWAMVENGGLLPSVAEQLLASLGPEDVARLEWQDLKLALQVEADIVGSGKAQLDIAHNLRLAHLMETAVVNSLPVDTRLVNGVQRALPALSAERLDLVARWQAFVYQQSQPDIGSQMSPMSPALASSASFNDTFDPHAATLDQRGSSIIVDELEKQGPNASASLNEALARFKNIRRAGRHPRYIAYAKLISAAAKDGRNGLVQDLFGMAKQDLPLMPQYPVVRHGWASILDAMVGASLTTGNRQMAADFHQQLREIGAAPSANTFGLYITTLKDSTKTFDEATEAVRVFQQAKSEGVEPSSFLYNALIGKLGKARRIDDCLFYFAEMRSRGIRPTSVTYGTIVNALCRVSDERFAQELFDEMESMPNYKPRPAPYNSMMQFFLTTKRDSSKVLEYYQRMQSRNIQPTMHTYKLLIDTHATLEPVNLPAAEAVLDAIRATGQRPEAVHYASLVHAKGCVLHDMAGAKKTFDHVNTDPSIRPQACLYQALFESMVANHSVTTTEPVLKEMAKRGVKMTPYIANTLIHGWALEKDIPRAKAIYDSLGRVNREPSTYDAMTRAFLAVQDRASASEVVHEMLERGYPSAVSGKILELLGHGMGRTDLSTPIIETPAAVEAAA